jgi:hypothetical protein
MEDDDLNAKQTFLRENILEKGYDAEDFMKLLQTKKGESGLDLISWTMNELKEAVKEFIKDKSPEFTPFTEEEKIENKIIENEKDNANEENEENYAAPPEEVYDLDKFSQEHPENPGKKEEYGKTQVNEFTGFTDKEGIVVRVSSPEKKEGGIFSKSYVSYLVETDPFGFRTRKRYSDFLWLKNTLSLVYSHCVIPPLCKKNYVDRFSEVLINKRMRSIEKFFEGLLVHPLIKNSQILYDFLSIEKETEFHKKKQKYGKITAPTNIKEIKTLEGDIKVSVTKQKEMYLQNIQDNCNINEELLQKVTKSYKNLMLLMVQIGEKMKEISSLWKLVYEKSTKYYDIHNTSQTYNILSKVMQNWAETEMKQIDILNTNVREYFRYVKNEYVSMRELGEVVESNKMIYKKAFDKLYFNKENLFKQQDLLEWGLSKEDLENKLVLLKNKELAFSKMLPKETKRVNIFKEFYGSYLNSIINEYERIRALNAKRHKEKITIFIRNLSDCLTDFHVSLADRLTEFSEMKDDEINSYPQSIMTSGEKPISNDVKEFFEDQ